MSQTPAPAMVGYPATADLDAPYEVMRFLPLVAWLLAIPHLILYALVTLVAVVCEIIALFTILFTMRVPSGLQNWVIRALRYGWRISSFMYFLRNPYPKFALHGTPQDPRSDPATYSVELPAEYHRFLPLVKWLLLIPHYICLWALGIAAVVCYIIGFFSVLFTGRWPEGPRDFVVGVNRWQMRVMSYLFLLVDKYPPFSLR